MQQLMKLQEADPRENGFWSWLEVEPSGELGEADTNALVGLIGVILGHLGAIGAILGFLWPAFTGGFARLAWYDWVFAILIFLSLGTQVFGLITWFGANSKPNEATTFRAWRTNFLFQAIHAIIEVIALIFYIIFALAVSKLAFLSIALYLGFFGGALIFSVVAVWLTFFLKNWWWNYDSEGQMRYEQDWSLFGNDDGFEGFAKEEEVEEAPVDEKPADNSNTSNDTG
jgi:hypothetical protein